MDIVNVLDVHNLVDSGEFDKLQEAYNKLYKDFVKCDKRSKGLEAKLEESNKLVEKYKKFAGKSLEKLNEIEHVKEELGLNLEKTNKLVDEIKTENQSLKVKVKGLEEDLVKSKDKLEKFSSAKLVLEPEFESVPIEPKDHKVHVPPLKRNHKENVNFAKLDKGKKYDVGTEVSKPVSKPPHKFQNKFDFVPTCHHCGVVGHIRPNCSLLRQEPKHVAKSPSKNTNLPKFVHVCDFCGVSGHIRPNCHKLKFEHSMFQSRTRYHIPLVTSREKLFGELLKNLRLLACDRKFQDFCLSQKNFVEPLIHFFFHGFSPTKPKTRAVWVRKDCLK